MPDHDWLFGLLQLTAWTDCHPQEVVPLRCMPQFYKVDKQSLNQLLLNSFIHSFAHPVWTGEIVFIILVLGHSNKFHQDHFNRRGATTAERLWCGCFIYLSYLTHRLALGWLWKRLRFLREMIPVRRNNQISFLHLLELNMPKKALEKYKLMAEKKGEKYKLKKKNLKKI